VKRGSFTASPQRPAANRILSFRAESRNLLPFPIVARDYSFWVYIVTNRNHSVLYIGVTNSLSRRTLQHREGIGAAFSSAYRCTKLIYYEHYRDIRNAIARETPLKIWSRATQLELINRLNPRWMEIGDQVFGE
jgi:putative endonuclease